MPSSDILVLGGGTNGLACATRLAQRGARVTVIEAKAVAGGGAATVEFAPGYRVSGLAHLLQGLDARVARGMGLASQGLSLSAESLSTTVLGPAPLTLTAAGRATGLTAEETEAWDALRTRLTRFAGALAPLRQMTPPRLGAKGNDLARLARIGLSLRGMGATEFREFLRLLLTNVADVLEDELTDDRLRGLCAFDATLGTRLGPRSPNSLLLWLNRLAGGPPSLPRGGMGTVAEAMAKAATAAGVTLRTGVRATRIEARDDRATGVTLDTGETLAADLVVSALCPKTTLGPLLAPGTLGTGTDREVRAIRARGAAAKLHLALTGTPDFGADLRHRLVVAPAVDAVEAAFNPMKYGEVPGNPVMEIVVPSAHEPGLAPPGHHVLSAILQFAPHDAPDRDAARAAMLEAALSTLERHAPCLRGLVAHAEVLMPWDIKERYGQSDWHHAELSVEQMLFLRPFAAAARYESPLPGLWLASAGSHPGGGINGAAGWNAAERILKEAA